VLLKYDISCSFIWFNSCELLKFEISCSFIWLNSSEYWSTTYLVHLFDSTLVSYWSSRYPVQFIWFNFSGLLKYDISCSIYLIHLLVSNCPYPLSHICISFWYCPRDWSPNNLDWRARDCHLEISEVLKSLVWLDRAYQCSTVTSNTYIKRRFFCMLRNTRSKLMPIIFIIYHLRLWLNSKFLFFDTFLNRQTNLKSMFSALSVK
jgi:hypothetical protein